MLFRSRLRVEIGGNERGERGGSAEGLGMDGGGSVRVGEWRSWGCSRRRNRGQLGEEADVRGPPGSEGEGERVRAGLVSPRVGFGGLGFGPVGLFPFFFVLFFFFYLFSVLNFLK